MPFYLRKYFRLGPRDLYRSKGHPGTTPRAPDG